MGKEKWGMWLPDSEGIDIMYLAVLMQYRPEYLPVTDYATSVRQVSSGYVNFVASGVLLTPCRLQQMSTLSCPVSTTATQFSPGRRRLLQTDCNEC